MHFSQLADLEVHNSPDIRPTAGPPNCRKAQQRGFRAIGSQSSYDAKATRLRRRSGRQRQVHLSCSQTMGRIFFEKRAPKFIYRSRILIRPHDQTGLKRQRFVGERLYQDAVLTAQGRRLGKDGNTCVLRDKVDGLLRGESIVSIFG